jgi:hypothetical protein
MSVHGKGRERDELGHLIRVRVHGCDSHTLQVDGEKTRAAWVLVYSVVDERHMTMPNEVAILPSYAPGQDW